MDLAVLDNINLNNFFVKFEIPAGREMKVWKGKAAEQFNSESGQFLAGGGMQVYIDWPADLKALIEKLPSLSKGERPPIDMAMKSRPMRKMGLRSTSS
ncbi:hypothetical protein [Herbaspirillum sp. ST 5-3]|uniref:hypothetical protein n=1 Tax=Oxalobacteraceae TaxID=75682 RepID=UPI0010A303D0|nr:hypothetical protein [Herbaspirillum sp. ST 5-3]